MFDNIISIIGGLNIFDLRHPLRFRFCSFQGFGLYLLSYMLVVLYDKLFQQKCVTSLTHGWEGIVDKCGLTASAVIFPFLYMLAAFILVGLFKRTDWSADAVFNNLSIVIMTEAFAIAAIYQLPNGTLQVQTNLIWYIPLLSLTAVAALAALSLLSERHTRPPKWTLATGLRASPGIFRLVSMYVLFSSAYYLGSFAVFSLKS